MQQADAAPFDTQAIATPSTMRRDVLSAYAASATRVGAWAVVSAIVYRLAGAEHFAMLAMIRGTIGILNYTAVGLAPALIRVLAETRTDTAGSGDQTQRISSEQAVFSSGFFVAAGSFVLGMAIAVGYAALFHRIHTSPASVSGLAPLAVLLIGAGALFRLFSDTASAMLQTRGRIALDNFLMCAADGAWAILTLVFWSHAGLLTASITYATAGALLIVLRLNAVRRLAPSPWPPRVELANRPVITRLISLGSLVLLAQMADYFYAPTDYILINRIFTSAELAAYAPGVQIDLGLLTLVTGLAGVLLPKTALAHVAGDTHIVRRYYVRGTLLSLALLSIAGVGVWLLAPVILRLWFGANPPQTMKILDLVLLGTVIGGSSAVGRSILIGMGKMKAFTIAAITAGVVNVIASYCFVRFAHLGLRGILWGTVLAIVGRCALWMPWYVTRSLRTTNR